MAITNGILDPDAHAERVLPVDAAGNVTVGAVRTPTVQRVNTATTTNVAAGALGLSVLVVAAASAASPTVGGVAIPAGVSVSFEAPTDDTLATIAIVTVSGDDVIITKVA